MIRRAKRIDTRTRKERLESEREGAERRGRAYLGCGFGSTRSECSMVPLGLLWGSILGHYCMLSTPDLTWFLSSLRFTDHQHAEDNQALVHGPAVGSAACRGFVLVGENASDIESALCLDIIQPPTTESREPRSSGLVIVGKPVKSICQICNIFLLELLVLYCEYISV